MPNISVSFEEIEQVAGDLGRGHGEIARELARMTGRIEQLLSAGFVTDQASGKFREAYLRISTAANTINDELHDVRAFLTGTATVLRDTDAQLAARIQ
ncbi:WXG100 family type VII secretion target [Leucobacter chromiireducens]|uniref:WXG100 family type VII secretion target n=1 Tax=Leucobacter chromiireducens TaxID=283877 RepID=UPI000F63E87F|nr:WXG100 family type VII secretion target [Leucobacter chromiireducens]